MSVADKEQKLGHCGAHLLVFPCAGMSVFSHRQVKITKSGAAVVDRCETRMWLFGDTVLRLISIFSVWFPSERKDRVLDGPCIAQAYSL